VQRLQLGMLLRRHREASGHKTKEVLNALDWYGSKLSRLESGGVTIAAAELDRLIELYDVPDEDADRLRDLGREARRRGKLQPVREYARTYLELERSATKVSIHRGELLPGILQTESYARVLLASGPADLPAEDINAVAAERASRIDRFTGDRANLWVVLGEAVLHRPVGGVVAHREQLAHLRRIAELPKVTLQVLPFSVGEYSALGMDFTILDLAEPPLTVVYVEALTDALYRDGAEDVERYRVALTKAQVAAASERESARMLEARLRDLA
jgi:hypothetical protein